MAMFAASGEEQREWAEVRAEVGIGMPDNEIC